MPLISNKKKKMMMMKKKKKKHKVSLYCSLEFC